MITVEKLIEKLKKYPKRTVVSVRGYEGSPITDSAIVKLVNVNLNDNKLNGYLGEHSIISEASDREKYCKKSKRLLISAGDDEDG